MTEDPISSSTAKSGVEEEKEAGMGSSKSDAVNNNNMAKEKDAGAGAGDVIDNESEANTVTKHDNQKGEEGRTTRPIDRTGTTSDSGSNSQGPLQTSKPLTAVNTTNQSQTPLSSSSSTKADVEKSVLSSPPSSSSPSVPTTARTNKFQTESSGAVSAGDRDSEDTSRWVKLVPDASSRNGNVNGETSGNTESVPSKITVDPHNGNKSSPPNPLVSQPLPPKPKPLPPHPPSNCSAPNDIKPQDGKEDNSKTDAASNEVPKLQSSTSQQPSSSSRQDGTSQKPPPNGDERTRPKEDIIRRGGGRAELEKLYAPFIAESDTSLEAARHRLMVAIDQTRQLRAAFTERVYGKYRVCLKSPPPTSQIVQDIKSDPQKSLKSLDMQMKRISAEKELEKTESSIINSELSSFVKARGAEANPLAPLNADNAEQLMYVTTGLNLVILPESDTPQGDIKFYQERGPFDPESGHRVRGINQSSAAASGVVLDRCRQALRLKTERDRRRQQQIKAGEDPDRTTKGKSVIQNYSRISIISTKPKVANLKTKTDASTSSPFKNANGLPVIPPTAKAPVSDSLRLKKTPLQSAKGSPPTLKEQQAINLAEARAIRARVQAGMSLNTLLSINPSHEELRTDGKISASTTAMMEGGVGGYFGVTSNKAPQRFRHPFSDSIGGRRPEKPVSSTGLPISRDPLSLPPFPTVKERNRAPKMSALPPNEGESCKAAGSIRRILDEFDPDISSIERPRKRIATDVSLMRSFRNAPSNQNEIPTGGLVNRTLALNVMKAVGLIRPSELDEEAPARPFQSSFMRSVLDSEKMKERGVVVDSGPFGTLVPAFERVEKTVFDGSKLGVASLVENRGDSSSNHQTDERIRGGGPGGYDKTTSGAEDKKIAGSKEMADSNPNHLDGAKPAKPPGATNGSIQGVPGSQVVGSQQRMVWDGRSQQILQAQIAQAQAAQLHGQLRPGGDSYSRANALQLAHQLRLSSMSQQHAHPQAGDLSEYINGLNQSQQAQATQAAYNWNAASNAAAAALGMNQHHPRNMAPLAAQEQARALQQNLAAQAAVAQQQQQQAAALLGNSAASQALRASGYAALGGNMLNASAAMMSRPGIAQIPIATQNAPSAQSSNNTNVLGPVMNKLEPDLEPTPMPDLEPTPMPDLEPTPLPDLEPTPIDESSLKKKQDDRSKRAEPSRDTADRDMTSHGNMGREGTGKKRKPSDAAVSSPVDANSKKIRVTNVVASREAAASSSGQGSVQGRETKPEASLQFFVPPTPAGVKADIAKLILSAKYHEAIGPLGECESTAQGEEIVSYVKALGKAVPIPERMVAELLKERLNAPAFKNSGVGSIPALSQGVILAVILHWLWRTQEKSFQRAFVETGKVERDPECQWLVLAALDKAIEALSKEVADAATRATSPLAVALLAHKNKNKGDQKGAPAPSPADSLKATTTRLDLLAASIVSKALSIGVSIDEQVNSILPHYQDLIGYLDDCRKCALYCRSQERVLLAALVARKSTMSFNFSHAYVSAMVRAGEAVGHGEVFEAVQNEKVGVSTMIPYDVFTDESGAWEDPCRPALGYNERLTGDEMMRRAHARAMIQKSLKKLQDRHGIKGGTPLAGPYADQPPPTPSSSGRQTPSLATPRGRRRSSISEPPIQPGTGSAPATSWALYDPKHISEPLERNSNTLENSPYGVFDVTTRPRSLSHTQGAAMIRQRGRGSIQFSGGKELRRQSSGRQLKAQELAAASGPDDRSEKDGGDASARDDNGVGGEIAGGLRRSTREIPWKDVAGIFQPVQLPGSTKDRNKDKAEASQSDVKDRTIFAPFVRKVDSLPIPEGIDESSDEEEDLSDEAILARHQVVLDRMKERLAVVLESRKRAAQDRRKSRGR